jgi:type IV secretion system protein TrbL
MSERAIGYVVSVGIKLMALAIVVSLGTSVFDTYTVSANPGIGEDVGLLLAAVVMVMLALKIPAIAGALISGGPQLNAGSAVMGAAGVAAGVAGGALAARALGGAVAGGWAAGGAQVAAARSAAGAIPPSGSLPSGGNGPAPSGGGLDPGGGPNTGGGGPGPGDFARAPVSSTVQTLRVAGERLLGGSPASSPAGSEDEASPAPSPAPSPPPPPPPSPPTSPPKETTAPAQPARSAVGDLARGAATTAAQSDEGGPGMSATPVMRDETPET